MRKYLAIGHWNDSKNTTCVAARASSIKNFRDDLGGNGFIPYAILTEKKFEAVKACEDVELWGMVKKMTSNYRKWNEICDYIEQCMEIMEERFAAVEQEQDDEQIEQIEEEGEDTETMLNNYVVTFEYADGVYCTNIAKAVNEESAKIYYSDYSWVNVRACADWEMEEAIAKGMPVITVADDDADQKTEGGDEMNKYMVKGYNKYGSHVFTDYAASLAAAVRIRKQFADGFGITSPALMPTIWKKTNDPDYEDLGGYRRLAGY